jgi:hypothetical protein
MLPPSRSRRSLLLLRGASRRSLSLSLSLVAVVAVVVRLAAARLVLLARRCLPAAGASGTSIEDEEGGGVRWLG